MKYVFIIICLFSIVASCQIGFVKQILSYKDRYYILDTPLGKTIYMFDSEGKYLKKIDKIGQGPGEYVMPRSIIINKKQK